MIWVMMKINNYAENPGRSNIKIFVWIGLKWEIKEDTVFVKKTKTRLLNVHLKQIHSKYLKSLKGCKASFSTLRSDNCYIQSETEKI